MDKLATVFKLTRLPNSKGPQSWDKSVMVLAKHFRPTDAQLNLLKKGLSFIPTWGTDRDQKSAMKADIRSYHRRVKLATFFGETDDNGEKPKFCLPSQWEPDRDKLPEQVFEMIKKDGHIWRTTNPELHVDAPNLSTEEINALKSLRKNQTIVIKPADKGSAVVIMDKNQYIREANRQLLDTHYYKPLDHPIFRETVPMIGEILERLHKRKYLTKNQVKYIKGQKEPRERLFYLLPKIHKPPEKWTVPFEIPPGRPIVSDCGSESYQVAEYIDHFLNPISTKHPSYVRDTYDFIEKVRKIRVSEKTLLFSIDVDSLYTNIETAAGLVAVRKWFDKYPDESRPDKEILELLQISLTRNDFAFNGEWFLQIKGTAMGKKFAPAYANIYMADWEETILPQCSKKPSHYYRYLDDIWGTWEHRRQEFEDFILTLNGHHPSIKVKFEIDPNSINFLDTTTYKEPNRVGTQALNTRVFFKPTDTHALLHRRSFHPKHTFKGIIKSQLIRFRRICNKETDETQATTTLFKALRERGYSRSFLRTIHKSHVKGTPRQTNMGSNQARIIPLITTFSNYGQSVNWQIKQTFSEVTKRLTLFQNYEIISAFKRNPNLKDFLVRSKLGPRETNIKQSKNRKTGYRNTELHTKNGVYAIACKKCGKQYVGETKNVLQTRLAQHKRNITDGRGTQTHLVQHFRKHGPQNMIMRQLEHNAEWSTGQRKRKEKIWIRKLNTVHPHGLNIQQN